MLQAKRQRIDSRAFRHDVDLLFPREGIGVGCRRPPGSNRKGVRTRWAVPTPAVRQRAVVWKVVRLGAAPRSGIEHAVIPECRSAFPGQPGTDFHDGSRAIVVPEKLVGPGPGHLHRFAGLACQARRLQALRTVGLAAETAADERGDHLHPILL